MGLDDVTKEILDEAEREADAIVAEAEEKKESILDEAREQRDAIVEEAEQEAQEAAEQLRKREIAAARMDAQKKKLEAREDVLGEAYDEFRQRVDELDEDAERELVNQALEELADEVDIGVVRAREELQDLAEEYGTFEPGDERGVIVETSDGSRRFDLTFSAAMEKTINASRKEISQVLFE